VLLVGIDLGTQSLKAVVCDERMVVRGAHAVPCTTTFPEPGWAEQDPRTWEQALAPAIGGALAAAGIDASDVAALAIAGQLDGCIAVDTHGAPLHPALIWQDRRAGEHVARVAPERLFALTGQVADASHMAPKLAWLRARGVHAARFHQPVSYLVERVCGAAVLDPSHASTTMLYDLVHGAWSRELLDAYELDAAQLPAVQPTTAVAGTLTSEGARLTGLPLGTRVAVGTGDDFATPLGAGITSGSAIACTLGTAEVVGIVAETAVFDLAARRSAGDPWREIAEPMVETHAYPTGAYFVENPGWLSGGAVRWAIEMFGFANEAEFDAAAAAATSSAGVTFVPALAGAMTPRWRHHARGTLHGLSAAHDRSHVARAILEGLAFGCRDVAQRLRALGLHADEVLVLGGGGRSRIWMQLRANALGMRHAVAPRTDTCAIAAAMIAAVAIGALPDLGAAAALAPAPTQAFEPAASLDDDYARYRRLVAQLAPLADAPWA